MSASKTGVRLGFVVGILFAIFFVAVAVLAPVISPMAEDGATFKQVGRKSDFKPHPPSEEAILGTLPQQFDVFHSLVWGARDALKFSFVVVIFSLFFGGLLGAISGLAGGWVNRVIMRVTDTFLTIPLIVGVVFLQQLVMVSIDALTDIPTYQMWMAGGGVEVGTNGLIDFFAKVDPLLFSFLALSWMTYARMMNASVINVKQEEFIEAARSVGVKNSRLLFRHILPNAYHPLLVMASRDLGNVLILNATLTFLKIGGQSVWGELLSMGRDWIIGPKGSLLDTWWVYLPVTIVVIVFSVTWNLIGEGLQRLVIERR